VAGVELTDRRSSIQIDPFYLRAVKKALLAGGQSR
jgi:hypothetical protein